MIKTLTIQQIDEIAPLWCKLNDLHRSLDVSISWQPRVGTWDDRKSELIKKCACGYLLQVVMNDDVQIGYCISTVSKERIGEIDSLYIDPHGRKQGIGTQLVKAALAWFSRQGCENVKLWVHPGNTTAIAFYWRFGFVTGPDMQKLANKAIQTDACGAADL